MHSADAAPPHPQVAAEAGMPLLALSPSAVLSKWSGESERFIRAAFTAAAALKPSILFIVSSRWVANETLKLLTPRAGPKVWY